MMDFDNTQQNQEAHQEDPGHSRVERLAQSLDKSWTQYQAIKQAAAALAQKPDMPQEMIDTINQVATQHLNDSVTRAVQEHLAGIENGRSYTRSGEKRDKTGWFSAKSEPNGTGESSTLSRNRLCRVDYDKMVAGVCGGLGEYFRIDSSIIRVIFMVAAFPPFAFIGLIAYIVLAILLPLKMTPDEE